MKTIDVLFSQGQLSKMQAKKFVTDILDQSISDAEVSAVLGVLRYKQESSEEVTGFCEALLSDVKGLTAPVDALDMCGTGGDSMATFNISTAAALLVSSIGVPVAKHGNRKVSSRCGSADVLEVMGIPIQSNMAESRRQLEQCGFTFLFAPNFHPGFSRVKQVREQLGTRTVFNMLGPLLNPLRPKFQVVGVFSPNKLDLMAKSLQHMGAQRAIVVSSESGMDEFALHEPSHYRIVTPTEVRSGVFDPRRILPDPPSLDSLRGGCAQQNADILQRLPENTDSPAAQVVCLNAAAGLFAYGLCPSIEEGYRQSQKALRTGRYMRQLQRLRGDYAQSVG